MPCTNTKTGQKHSPKRRLALVAGTGYISHTRNRGPSGMMSVWVLPPRPRHISWTLCCSSDAPPRNGARMVPHSPFFNFSHVPPAGGNHLVGCRRHTHTPTQIHTHAERSTRHIGWAGWLCSGPSPSPSHIGANALAVRERKTSCLGPSWRSHAYLYLYIA